MVSLTINTGKNRTNVRARTRPLNCRRKPPVGAKKLNRSAMQPSIIKATDKSPPNNQPSPAANTYEPSW